MPNEIEAEQLTGLACDGDQAVKAARRVCDEWARVGAVVTLGARGAAPSMPRHEDILTLRDSDR